MLVVPGRRLRLRGAAGAVVQLPVPLRASQLPGALAGAPAKHKLNTPPLPLPPVGTRSEPCARAGAHSCGALVVRRRGTVASASTPYRTGAQKRGPSHPFRLHATDQTKGDGGECLHHHHHPSFAHPLPPARPHTVMVMFAVHAGSTRCRRWTTPPWRSVWCAAAACIGWWPGRGRTITSSRHARRPLQPVGVE